MYKVYINPSKNAGYTNNGYKSDLIEMKELSDIVTTRLLKEDNIIVYVEQTSTGLDKEMFKSDIRVELRTSAGNGKGIEITVNEENYKSEGFGKEIYNKVHKIYYDNNIDKGLFYEKLGGTSANEVTVILKIIYRENINDVNWLQTNKQAIGNKIAEGIISAFTLIPC